MKAHIESTEQMIHINGVPARVWVGVTEHGVPIQLAITRVAINVAEDQGIELGGGDRARAVGLFLQELEETHAPVPELPAFSLRMIL